MTVIAKSNETFIAELTPEDMKFIIAWNEAQDGPLDLDKLEVGYTVDVAQKYKNIVNITNIKQKIETARTKAAIVLDELNQIQLDDINK